MALRSFFDTSHLRRLITALVLSTIAASIYVGSIAYRVQVDWNHTTQIYAEWITSGKQQSCSEIFKDATQDFADLHCKNGSQQGGHFFCDDPDIEKLRKQINHILSTSACPVDASREHISGLVSLSPPLVTESYWDYFFANNHINATEFVAVFSALIAALFLLLSLIKRLFFGDADGKSDRENRHAAHEQVPQRQAPRIATEATRHCTRCWTGVEPGAKFCRQCGISLQGAGRISISESGEEETPTGWLRYVIPPFIRKHWRGQYSLPISYWVVGIGVGISNTLLVQVERAMVESTNIGLRQTGALLLVLLTATLMTVVWFIVGAWRSSSKHVQRGGHQFWAVFAKVVLVLNIVSVAGVWVNKLPIFTEATRMLAGDDDIPPSKIRIIRDGTELELSGGITFGTSVALEKALQTAPKVKVIHLNSLGGRITEANKLFALIQPRELTTYTSTECASACTIVFMAGKHRYLSNKGKLGFHSTSIAGHDGAVVTEINNEVREKLIDNGVAEAFVNRALATSASSLWTPTYDELIKAHVIDAVVNPRFFGTSGIGSAPDATTLEKSLLDIPFYSALAKYDQKNYTKLKDLVVTGLQKGESQMDIQGGVNDVMQNEVLPHYIKIAPDAEITGYWRSQVEQMRTLANVSPQVCADFIYPAYAKKPVDFQQYLPDDTRHRYFLALADMIRASNANPQIARKDAALNSDLAWLWRDLKAKYPEATEVLGASAKYKDRPASLCNAPIALYSEILSLPSDRSGPLLRYIVK